MKLDKIRRLAARILKTGNKNVWMDTNHLKEIQEAMTKEDVRTQISQGHIKKKASAGQSRGRTRFFKLKRKKGRKRGFGKRRGTFKARIQKKKHWMSAVRAQRAFLRELRKNKKVDSKAYSKIYRLIKGGYFKGKRYILAHLKQ